ncbi:S-adenosyl-L-methionine-dependent methyltransferase [Mycena vitilis]|nr:S-adenosyl-L-methionine-dependent methyltransferase [Mycena vitilis]KAJ6509146.1 S-adenosyl-L-methionine-dependent methyltransferase [Mycena vitilis]
MTEYQISAKESVSIPVLQAYDLWAKTYDSDGNVLQLLDTELVNELLPGLLSQPQEIVVDLGCGTGRNTEKLLRYQNIQQIYGLDGTPGMLAQAKSRITDPRLHLHQYDIVADSPPCESFLPFTVDAVISTLVIEHLPSLPQFFTLVHKMLRSGGWCLVTNMHENMGARTGAGFVDENGVRVTMDKFVHTVEDVSAAALACGFELQGSPMVRRVENEEHAKSLSSRAGKWVGVKMLYGMVFVKTG